LAIGRVGWESSTTTPPFLKSALVLRMFQHSQTWIQYSPSPLKETRHEYLISDSGCLVRFRLTDTVSRPLIQINLNLGRPIADKADRRAPPTVFKPKWRAKNPPHCALFSSPFPPPEYLPPSTYDSLFLVNNNAALDFRFLLSPSRSLTRSLQQPSESPTVRFKTPKCG
jgi:hypothetical protein